MTGTQKKKSSIFAVLSLVFALIGVFVMGAVIAGTMAIVLGVVGLKQTSSGGYKGQGIALAGILLGAIACIAYFGGAAYFKYYGKGSPMPAAVRARAEGAASSLLMVADASAIFYTVNQRFPENFDELVYSDPPYIERQSVEGASFGYQYEIRPTLDSREFFITAVPLPNEIRGMISVCVTEDGYARIDPSGGDIISHDACKRLPGV